MKVIAMVFLIGLVLAGFLWALNSSSAEAQTGGGEEQAETVKGAEDEEQDQSTLSVFVPKEKLPAGSSVSFPVDI